MDQTVEFLKAISMGTIEVLNKFNVVGRKDDFSFDFDTDFDIDFLKVNILKEGHFVELYNKLRTIEGPVLYWIEVISNNTSRDIFETAKHYKLSGNRNMAALSKSLKNESRILYVGKVEKGILSRVMMHMGFFKSQGTQGLQIYHWGRQIGLKVRFHLMQLHVGCEHVLRLWEKALAGRLNPIIGSHR